MAYLVRSACLGNYAEVARAVGLEPFGLLKAAGLSRFCLLDPDSKTPAGDVGRLLEASARAAGIEDFGLRMAESRRPSILGPIALLIQEEPTVRKALQSLSWYLRLHNESLSLGIEEADGLVILRTEAIVKRSGPTRQATELSVGALHQILRSLLGMAWKPERVCFSHGAPASLSTHRRIFGTRVEFGCDLDGIVCPSRILDHALPKSDPLLARYARQYLETSFALPDTTMSDKVRRLVGVLLPFRAAPSRRWRST